ncbi:hypothetical protein FQN54_004026 [Arachnomyces sp. PD_36]|nr:hypothetical protein FQN54_004026 [Arachnomyces sp. PD_36]
MSLQTTYLANGTWTTRRVDISELLNDTRDPQRVARPNVALSVKEPPPIIGMLSQTIIQSPIAQWVLPARLRHQDKQDVVFVGDNFIQIRESVGSGHLEDVATKADFDTKIISVGVINLHEEPSLEAQIKQGSGRAAQEPKEDGDLPPQMLVLALNTKELVFVYATESIDGRVDFVHTRRPLPADVSLPEQYGRHIAVDPRSRAIAVSASQDYFGVFSLKPQRMLRAEMRSGNMNPIWEERFFRVDGDILKMEFLYPTPGEDRMVLLLFVSKELRTYMVCYDWDITGGIRNSRPKVIRRQLPLDEGMSPILVPLRKPASFLLIASTNIVIYNDITDPTHARKRPHRYPMKPPGAEDPHRSLLWTQWARPVRNWLYSRNNDGIYLCREDSKILYLEVGNQGEVNLQHEVGSLNCDIDTGFTILDRGFEGGDLLVVAGSMGDGGVFVEDARQPPRCIQSITNWAPVLDSVLLGPGNPEDTSESEKADFSGDRIFACHGPTFGRGAITELRHGLQARIGLMLELQDPSSILSLWVVTDAGSGGALFFSSMPDCSLVIYMPDDAQGEIRAIDGDLLGADLNTPTLAAGSTPEGVIIQVTSSAIHLSVYGVSSPRISEKCEGGEQIIAAATAGNMSLVAVAVRRDDAVHVRVGRVGISAESLQFNAIGQPLGLPYEPITLSIEILDYVPTIFIGTREGKILATFVDIERGFGPLVEQDIILEEGSIESKTCESLALISTSGNRAAEKRSLLCGLRSGNLVVFNIKRGFETGLMELKQVKRRKIGETTVRLRRAGNQNKSAIFACGDGFWSIAHVEDPESSQYILEKVWITDHNNPSYLQSAVDVFTCVDSHPYSKPGTLDGSLVCIVGDQLLVCTLENTTKSVPRRIPIPGSPNRMIYSKYLKTLVIGYTYSEESESNGIIRRCVRPRIDFIDPDSPPGLAFTVDISDDEGEETPGNQLPRPTGSAGERITAIADWNSTDGKNNYHMIVVGTTRPVDLKRGRLVYITARRHPDDLKIHSTVKHAHLYEEPIRAITPYGQCSLVVTTGKEVILQKFDIAEKRWRRVDRYHLESPGISVSVREPFIYVSTSRESLVALKVTEDKISLYSTDPMQRGGLHHTLLHGDYPITMTSNRGGTIVGLSEMDITPKDKTSFPVFKVDMPHSSVRLLQSTQAPAIKDSHGIYGTALGGSVYRFTTLKEHEWRLLRFLQNVCMIDPIVCPFSPRLKSKAVNNVEPSTIKPDFLHVNGDILSRLTYRGISYFKEMIAREDSSRCTTDIGEDEDEAELIGSNEGGISKPERFAELVPPVLGEVEDQYTAVMEWIVKLLQVAF